MQRSDKAKISGSSPLIPTYLLSPNGRGPSLNRCKVRSGFGSNPKVGTIVPWCNGSISDSDSAGRGSNPCGTA